MIAEENFGLLDTDMVWNLAPYPGDFERDKAALTGSPLLRSLEVFKRGDVTFLTTDVSQALSFWTPLATPTLVDGINDILAARAVAG